MANLPSGVRRVYNHFYKRKATGGNSYTPTPSEIKDYLESQGFGSDNITEEQFNQTINHFSSCELSFSQVEQSAELINQTGDAKVDDFSSGTLTKQERHSIVSSKASQMNIQLSADDIDYVAGRIDIQVGTTLDEILHQTESLLCKYADYKQQEGIQKIDAMFGRVYNHVQSNNEDTSQHISRGLQQFGRDIEQSEKDFKSSISNALSRLKIPGVSA